MAGVSVGLTVAGAIVVAMLGYLAARSIVAEADAHRMNRQDAWFGPTCASCGGPLDPSMLRCRPERHSQRGENVWILIATVLAFVGVAAALPSLWLIPAYLVFTGFTVLLTVTDLDTKLIPNRILMRGIILSMPLLVVGGLVLGDPAAVIRAAIAGGAYFILMLVLAVVARGALGMGDVKVAFLLGVFVGYLGWGQLILSVFLAFILGGLTALILLVTRRAGRKDAIAFGPFLTSAAILTVVFGERFLDWYS